MDRVSCPRRTWDTAVPPFSTVLRFGAAKGAAAALRRKVATLELTARGGYCSPPLSLPAAPLPPLSGLAPRSRSACLGPAASLASRRCRAASAAVVTSSWSEVLRDLNATTGAGWLLLSLPCGACRLWRRNCR